MPPNIYNGSSGRINLKGYDPSLAEEAMARQERAQQQQLGQLQDLGQINAKGAAERGAAMADLPGQLVGGYFQGQKDLQHQQTHEQRMALSEEDLANQKAEHEYLDTEIPESTDPTTGQVTPATTNRARERDLRRAKTEEEIAQLKKKTPKAIYHATDRTSKSGLPLRFNDETGQYEVAGNEPVKDKSDTKEDKVTLVDDVDDKGNPIKRAVVLKPGQTYAGKPDKTKTPKIPASTATKVGSYDSALKMVDDLEKEYNGKASGTFSSIKGAFPGTEADKYEKAADMAAQSLGTILEGGKLSDADYKIKYKPMVPRKGDTNGVAAQKTLLIKKLLHEKRKGEIEGLQQSGFDVSGFTPGMKDEDIKSGINVGGGEATAAPALKAPEEMTPAELDAELKRLKGQ